jgi:hypothetical protein
VLFLHSFIFIVLTILLLTWAFLFLSLFLLKQEWGTSSRVRFPWSLAYCVSRCKPKNGFSVNSGRVNALHVLIVLASNVWLLTIYDGLIILYCCASQASYTSDIWLFLQVLRTPHGSLYSYTCSQVVLYYMLIKEFLQQAGGLCLAGAVYPLDRISYHCHLVRTNIQGFRVVEAPVCVTLSKSEVSYRQVCLHSIVWNPFKLISDLRAAPSHTAKQCLVWIGANTLSSCKFCMQCCFICSSIVRVWGLSSVFHFLGLFGL